MTPDDVKAVLEEAGRTLMLLPVPRNGKPAGIHSAMPEVIRNYAEWFGAQTFMDSEDRRLDAAERNAIRLHATARQIQQLDRALEWLWLIEDPITRRITLARSLKYPATGRHVASVRKLSKALRCSHEHIRNVHYKGLCEISRKVNNS